MYEAFKILCNVEISTVTERQDEATKKLPQQFNLEGLTANSL
jgi:hypothetical protein